MAPTPIAKAAPRRLDETTGGQNNSNMGGGAGVWSSKGTVGWLWANNGTFLNPMGFPGYENVYTGSYSTYRWILQLPIVRLVRSLNVAELVSTPAEYEKADPSTPDEDVAMVKRQFDPLWIDLVNDFFIRGKDMGNYPGEPIWIEKNGEYVLQRVKPCLPDASVYMHDNYGNFSGFKNWSLIDQTIKMVELSAPYKAWKFTYDGEAGYSYGRSWLENIRSTAWKDWLDCAQQLQRLSSKITGIVTIITSPSGTFPGPDGKPVSHKKNAEAVIKALGEGAIGAWFPSIGLVPDSKGNLDALKVLIELAGKSMTNIDVKDFSGNAAAIGPILERMKHDEVLMFAGGCQPPRTGLEAEHGAKADAEQHTSNASANTQNEGAIFARQCQPLVDAVLVLNRGDNAAGKVRIKIPFRAGDKIVLFKALMLSLISQPDIAMEFIRTANMNVLMDFMQIARAGDFSVDSIKKMMDDRAKQQVALKGPTGAKPKTPEPQGGRPKTKKRIK